VTDLHLPGKSGQELVQLLRESCRELAVVYVTGTQATDQLGVDDRAAVVKKPFRSEQLLSALQTARTLMDSRVA
jgi:FixJ family two-component response regulator